LYRIFYFNLYLGGHSDKVVPGTKEGRWEDEGRRVAVMSKDDYGVGCTYKTPSPWSRIL
jgi:hypothetical protein